MERVSTQSASRGIGPYSQAVKANGFIFVSGQLGLDPDTGTLVQGGFEAQTDQALRNVREILAAGGSAWSKVVKATIYLSDIENFAVMNDIYAKVLGPIPPARAAIQVAQLPLGALIEIDIVALA
jgi:2-iminobutanoate/2-iminopropanoate deaminase